ncbi:MAG: cyclase [Steroidobacterales bacterium]
MYVHHEVTDYAIWRKAYDGFSATRRKMGVSAQAVYRSVDDPNDVTVTHDFANADKAKAFAASDELKAAMQKAGVKGVPQIWFTTRASK